jgi:hypothetical protein
MWKTKKTQAEEVQELSWGAASSVKEDAAFIMRVFCAFEGANFLWIFTE